MGPYLGCEIPFHNNSVAQVFKQPLHPLDVMFRPIAPWERVKLSVTDDESQANAAFLLSDWIDLQNNGKLHAIKLLTYSQHTQVTLSVT